MFRMIIACFCTRQLFRNRTSTREKKAFENCTWKLRCWMYVKLYLIIVKIDNNCHVPVIQLCYLNDGVVVLIIEHSNVTRQFLINNVKNSQKFLSKKILSDCKLKISDKNSLTSESAVKRHLNGFKHCVDELPFHLLLYFLSTHLVKKLIKKGLIKINSVDFFLFHHFLRWSEFFFY